MPIELEASEAYEKAQNLAEAALEAYAEGDKLKGDRLMEEAQSLDPDAVQDVMDELEEDAAAEHNPEAVEQHGGSEPDRFAGVMSGKQ
jgi:hypothetical protein